MPRTDTKLGHSPLIPVHRCSEAHLFKMLHLHAGEPGDRVKIIIYNGWRSIDDIAELSRRTIHQAESASPLGFSIPSGTRILKNTTNIPPHANLVKRDAVPLRVAMSAIVVLGAILLASITDANFQARFELHEA